MFPSSAHSPFSFESSHLAPDYKKGMLYLKTKDIVTFYFLDQVSMNLFPLEVFPTFSLVAIGKWLIKLCISCFITQ